MSIRDEVLETKQEVKKLKEESLAMSLLKDYKKQNKRLFVMWIITFLTLVAVTCYTIYLVSDIGIIEETTITQENKDGYNNYIGNDGDITNGKASD